MKKLVIAFALLSCLLAVVSPSTAEEFDFFYLVQQVMSAFVLHVYMHACMHGVICRRSSAWI